MFSLRSAESQCGSELLKPSIGIEVMLYVFF